MPTVIIRGEERDVEITEDGGHESDTDAWDIEWVFADGWAPDPELTDEEIQIVSDACYEYLRESYADIAAED